MMLQDMNHITLAITDIQRSFTFYREVLGLKPLCLWDKGAYFLVGNFWFCLNVDEKRQPSPCYTHYAFTVSQNDFDEITARITQSGAYVFKENTSPGESLYFLDPDGHKLEIHASNWKERVAIKKENPGLWKNVEWFV